MTSRSSPGPSGRSRWCRAAPDAGLADGVAPDTPLVGLLLPYTPLHHLLVAAVGAPLVLTSGNVSDEPIAQTDDDARNRLAPLADALLLHDRPIATRCDDSVAQVVAGGPMILRRSRGYVPRPIVLARPIARPVLAVGAHLKNTFCLAHGDLAYLGPHVGDLDNLAAQDFCAEAIERMQRLVRVTPTVMAYDAMPDGPSARWAERQVVPRRIAVQHHHAHVVSAMAEHGLEAPVIGVAFDGTGWGPDGTAWGGEILLADARRYRRLATLRPIALAGGDAAIHAPWRIALALCEDAFDGALPRAGVPPLARIPPGEVAGGAAAAARRVNAPLARGLGRYFDGIARAGAAGRAAHYEAELAMAWTAVADRASAALSVGDRSRGGGARARSRPMVRAVVADLAHGVAAATIAARFHETHRGGDRAVVAEAAAGSVARRWC
jgi:hydrogenase maturation protein HypF